MNITPKKIYKWLISTRKDARKHLSSEKWRSKPRDTTSQPLEFWPQLEMKSQITITREDVEKSSSSYTAGGNAKWCSCFGKWSGNS